MPRIFGNPQNTLRNINLSWQIMNLSSWTMQHRGSAIFQAGRTWWHATNTGLANTESYAMEPKHLQVKQWNHVSSWCMMHETSLQHWLPFLVLIWVPATVCISILRHQEPSMKAEVEASRTLFVLDCAKSWAILRVPGVVLGQSKPWTSWNLASCADEIPWTNAIQSLGHKRLVWAPMRKGVKKKKCEQEELCSM